MAQQLRSTLAIQTDFELDAVEVANVFEDTSEMMRRARALFAQTAHPQMSAGNSFTNTYDIVLAMHNRGFRAVSVQGGTGTDKKVLVRMRSADYDNSSNKLIYAPELVLLDSDDGTSRLKLLLGTIRFACMNEMIAADFRYARSYMHYAKDLMSQIRFDLEDVDTHVDQLNKRVSAMREYKTTYAERILLADTAIKQRFGKDRDGDFVATLRDTMLRIRRDEDDSTDLYTAMNIVQENVLRGGGSYVINDRLQHIRPITQVDRNVHINQALWMCAENILANKRAA